MGRNGSVLSQYREGSYRLKTPSGCLRRNGSFVGRGRILFQKTLAPQLVASPTNSKNPWQRYDELVKQAIDLRSLRSCISELREAKSVPTSGKAALPNPWPETWLILQGEDKK
jgi:hypothetical protein